MSLTAPVGAVGIYLFWTDIDTTQNRRVHTRSVSVVHSVPTCPEPTIILRAFIFCHVPSSFPEHAQRRPSVRRDAWSYRWRFSSDLNMNVPSYYRMLRRLVHVPFYSEQDIFFAINHSRSHTFFIHPCVQPVSHSSRQALTVSFDAFPLWPIFPPRILGMHSGSPVSRARRRVI